MFKRVKYEQSPRRHLEVVSRSWKSEFGRRSLAGILFHIPTIHEHYLIGLVHTIIQSSPNKSKNILDSEYTRSTSREHTWNSSTVSLSVRNVHRSSSSPSRHRIYFPQVFSQRSHSRILVPTHVFEHNVYERYSSSCCFESRQEAQG